MQPTRSNKKEGSFFTFLKRSFDALSGPHMEHEKAIKHIEHYFSENLFSGSPSKDQIILLRNAILPWIIEFPPAYYQLIMHELKTKQNNFNHIEKIVGMQKIQTCVSMTIIDITPRLISILGFYIQLINKEITVNALHNLDNQNFKEYLVRNFYCPLVFREFHKSYLMRTKNHCYDLDRAIEQAPKNLNQLVTSLNDLKNELNVYICASDEIKLRWELSRDIYELIEEFSNAISPEDFNVAILMIEKFHSIWVRDANRLGGLYPIVEAYIGSALSWLAIYGLTVQLAWFMHYSHETTLGMTLLTLSFGANIIAQGPSSRNSFFKLPQQNKTFFQRKLRWGPRT